MRKKIVAGNWKMNNSNSETNKLLNELKEIPAKNGEDLYTSLDISSQIIAYEQLDKRRGAVVAIEIETGAIVTYVSSPSFPINKITNGMSQADFNQLLNDKDNHSLIELDKEDIHLRQQ